MISFKQWLVLVALYTVFMVAGAAMFLSLELDHEYQERESLAALKNHVTEVMGYLGNETRDTVEVLLLELGEECGHDFFTLEQDKPLTWTMWNSFFFTFTVITTIGFGHMAPKTPWGRVACIAYAFIGVPFNGIVIASLADIFSHKLINWDVRRWAARYKSWVTVLFDTIVFLVPGLVVFLVLPSFVLVAVEDNWTYLDAFYFSFITLTTIGFGDHVAGQQERGQVWMWVYKVTMVIWFIFGLGYIIMIITFVQKALKSKKILRVEKRMTSALKKHVSKVHRDLGAVRKAININSSNSSSGNKSKIKRTPTTTSNRHPHLHTPTAPSTKDSPTTSTTDPSPPLTPFARPRSASEPDLTLYNMTRTREIEGMNVMLDFIERLLRHQETQVIDNITNIIQRQEGNEGDDDEEEDEDEDEDDEEKEEKQEDKEKLSKKNLRKEEKRRPLKNKKKKTAAPPAGDHASHAGIVNEGYQFGDDIQEVGDWLFPTRLSGHVEELLYLMVLGRGKDRYPTINQPCSPIIRSPNPQQRSMPSPPPSYNSINPRLLPQLSCSSPSSPSLPPSPYHTLTLLSQLFSGEGSGGVSPYPPSTPYNRSPRLISRHPPLSLLPPSSPLFLSPTQREEEEGQVTRF